MAPSTKSYICPVCKNCIKKTEYSVACSGCVDYFHPKCINISDNELRNNKALKFVCTVCKRKSDQHIGQLLDEVTNKIKKQMEEQTQKCLADFQEIVDGVMGTFRVEFMSSLRIVKEDVNACKQHIMDLERQKKILENEVRDCKSRLRNSEIQSSVMQRRLNRADIIVNGLPRSIHHLREPIVNIAKLCKVDLNPADIQHCCYIFGGRAVLVKFNSVHLRDTIMANYFRSNRIALKDVINTEVSSRIFLNDHLTPAASKLVNTCRKMLRSSKINKYVLINGDVPKVRLTFANGSERVCDMEMCERMDADDTNATSPNADGDEAL